MSGVDYIDKVCILLKYFIKIKNLFLSYNFLNLFIISSMSYEYSYYTIRKIHCEIIFIVVGSIIISN